MSDDWKILILNGPNLNRLGLREPAIYGATTYAQLVALCERRGEERKAPVEVRQTNAEGEMIDWLHEAADRGWPVILNAAGWTHTSVAIGDACAQLSGLLIEVHISNIHKRETFRHHSYVSPHADGGIIVGMGVAGYLHAVDRIADEAQTDAE
ncbi:type II 3-dehydroquinate dehydratase [Glycomyces paridis]|uniref:3-dehydroquinate dehydratase n=1 Tax=Glycomyces paridis TaxID=2126555 RepID=A0A4S8PQC0_9ACTN|nr:type II 3-dehydroquinate dehydratase [Glycomyces paridis]THV30739.1 type II 3-dehydroquinate dehydratase [Glycomyces paridis]